MDIEVWGILYELMMYWMLFWARCKVIGAFKARSHWMTGRVGRWGRSALSCVFECFFF